MARRWCCGRPTFSSVCSACSRWSGTLTVSGGPEGSWVSRLTPVEPSGAQRTLVIPEDPERPTLSMAPVVIRSVPLDFEGAPGKSVDLGESDFVDHTLEGPNDCRTEGPWSCGQVQPPGMAEQRRTWPLAEQTMMACYITILLPLQTIVHCLLHSIPKGFRGPWVLATVRGWRELTSAAPRGKATLSRGQQS
ncbi:uncharacterized protein M6D78_016975 isoform 1-T2 [Vipera latastei]